MNTLSVDQQIYTNNFTGNQITHHTNCIKLGKFNILYLNINSLYNKLDEIEKFLEQNSNIQFIALTEIRIHREQNFAFNFNNFQAFFNNRNDGEGGVALYVHESLVSNLKESVCTANIHRLVVEIITLNINIVVVYKQPNANIDTFFEIYANLLNTYKRTLIVGDMNIDLLSMRNRITEQYLNITREHNFFILNKIHIDSVTRTATRWRNNVCTTSNTIIDHMVSDLGTFDFSLSIGDSRIINNASLASTIK